MNYLNKASKAQAESFYFIAKNKATIAGSWKTTSTDSCFFKASEEKYAIEGSMFPIDYTCRVRIAPSITKVEYAPTKSLFSPMITCFSLMSGMINNLWKMFRYNQEYYNYLKGAYTDEEFDIIEEKYQRIPEDRPEEEIAIGATLLLRIIGEKEEISENEIADILNVMSNDVHLALENAKQLSLPFGKEKAVQGWSCL